jgi:hypothetical protein
LLVSVGPIPMFMPMYEAEAKERQLAALKSSPSPQKKGDGEASIEDLAASEDAQLSRGCLVGGPA